MSAPLWTSAEIAAATASTPDGNFRIEGLTFDTREVAAGDLFLALQGTRDGHDFVGDAAVRGATAALVSRRVDVDIPQMVVPDVLQGLCNLGVAARVRAKRRIAVTGSVGKTSVTQAIWQALQLSGSAHGSIKSFNNHIGVPLTLARTPHGTDAAVFEVGMNHPGEIAPLAQMVAPHAAVITTVAPVHIEHFDSEAAIADEKARIFAGLQPGGVAIIPSDTPHTERLMDHATRAGATIATFGRQGRDARVLNVSDIDCGIAVTAQIKDRAVSFTVGVPGAHWANNGLAVLLALDAIGEDLVHGIAALKHYRPMRGRGAISTLRLPQGDVTLIDDSYNANPASMRASLATLARHPGRRLVAFTDMLELGSHSDAAHADLAPPVAAADVALVYCAGPAMQVLFDAVPKSRQALWSLDVVALGNALLRDVRGGDVVLVKGSNGSKAAQIVTMLEGAQR